MAEVTAKYQIKLPTPIFVNGEEVLAQEPIRMITSMGEAVIHPPGSKDKKPQSYVEPQQAPIVDFRVGGEYSSNFWQADTIWIDLTTDITPSISGKELSEQLLSEMQRILLRLVRLLRQRCQEPPIPLPKRPKEFGFTIQPHAPRLKPPFTHFSGKPVPIDVFIPQDGGLTGERWEEVRQDIASGAMSELCDEFIVDAKVALQLEQDANRAILYAAIACEIFIKEYSEKAAKEAGIDQPLWEYLTDRRLKVLEYYDEILSLLKHRSLPKEEPDIYEQVEYLFRARNSIMHTGKPQYKDRNGQLVNLTVPPVAPVRQLIDRASLAISWVRGL